MAAATTGPTPPAKTIEERLIQLEAMVLGIKGALETKGVITEADQVNVLVRLHTSAELIRKLEADTRRQAGRGDVPPDDNQGGEHGETR